MSGIRLPYCLKLAVNWENGNDVIIFRHEVIVKVFDVVLFNLSSLVTVPNFKSIVNIITGSGVLAIPFYKGLTRNLEIGNTPSKFYPISGDWCE